MGSGIIVVTYWRSGKFYDFLKFSSPGFAKKWVKMLRENGAHGIRVVFNQV